MFLQLLMGGVLEVIVGTTTTRVFTINTTIPQGVLPGQEAVQASFQPPPEYSLPNFSFQPHYLKQSAVKLIAHPISANYHFWHTFF